MSRVGTLDDTYEEMAALEEALTRFEDALCTSWATAERAFDPLDGLWADTARHLLDEEHEALRASMQELVQAEGPARLAFLRERRALLQSYLRHRV